MGGLPSRSLEVAPAVGGIGKPLGGITVVTDAAKEEQQQEEQGLVGGMGRVGTSITTWGKAETPR